MDILQKQLNSLQVELYKGRVLEAVFGVMGVCKKATLLPVRIQVKPDVVSKAIQSRIIIPLVKMDKHVVWYTVAD